MCLGMLRDSEWKPSTKMSAVLEFARQLLRGTFALYLRFPPWCGMGGRVVTREVGGGWGDHN